MTELLGLADQSTINAEVFGASESLFTKPRPSVSAGMVTEAAQLLQRAWSGSNLAQYQLREVFTTADFQWAAFVVLDRAAMLRYAELPAQWTQYVTEIRVRDFRPKKLVDFTQSGFSLELVPESDEYPEQDRSGLREWSVKVSKFGRRYSLTWESMINDQLNELQDIPDALARAARDLENKTAIMLLTDGDGPNSAFFNAPNGNAPTTLPLTIDNLETALNAIGARTYADGRPLVIGQPRLIIPSALQGTADKILGANVIRQTTGGQEVEYTNYLRGRVQVVVEPWLSYFDKGANRNTTWYLVPAPDQNIMSLALAKLIGHETPEMRVKADTGVTVGGGNISPTDGSFHNDDIQYRVRHVVGGGTGEPLATYASTGA